MVTQLVLGFCVEMALSSSSSAPVRFSFLTRLLTAFSHHLSSAAEPSDPFFHPRRRFTNGGLLNGSIPLITLCTWDAHVSVSHVRLRCWTAGCGRDAKQHTHTRTHRATAVAAPAPPCCQMTTAIGAGAITDVLSRAPPDSPTTAGAISTPLIDAHAQLPTQI